MSEFKAASEYEQFKTHLGKEFKQKLSIHRNAALAEMVKKMDELIAKKSAERSRPYTAREIEAMRSTAINRTCGELFRGFDKCGGCKFRAECETRIDLTDDLLTELFK